MKIVIINQHPDDLLGGSELQCDIIATYLTRFGHQVTYLAVKGIKATYDTEYSVIPVDNLNPFRLYSILRELNPDVVYWRHNKKRLFTTALGSKLVGSKFVYSMSTYSDSCIWIDRGVTVFSRFLKRFKNASGPLGVINSFVFLTDPLASAINYLAIPFFVDGIVSLNCDYLESMPKKRKTVIHNSMPAVRQDFCWPKPYVVWVGNLKGRKNPEKYYELAEALQNTQVDFLMVGPVQERVYGSLANAGQKLANFHFLGARAPIEVNGILNSALFLVNTCDPEGFGNNFIQAWLQGKPTISLYFDPEGTIEREKIGYLAKTFPRLEELTRYLIKNESARIEMGRRAQAYSKEHFNSDSNVRQLETFLFNIVDGNGDYPRVGG